MKRFILPTMVAIWSGSAAVSEPFVDDSLLEDLTEQRMTPQELGDWMRDVIALRDFPCNSVTAMSGNVPRVNSETRRNAAISVSCENATYYISVGIGRGWQVERN